MRIGTDHTQKQKEKKKKRRGCVVPWDILQSNAPSDDKSILLALPNLLRCASWPAMREKRSCACPALGLPAGRAAKWQLFPAGAARLEAFQKHGLSCRSKNPWGKGAKGRAELAPATKLHWAREPERVAPWRCKGSRQDPSGMGPEEPREGAVLSATEDKKQVPGASLGARPGSLASFLPPDAGHEGHLRGA